MSALPPPPGPGPSADGVEAFVLRALHEAGDGPDMAAASPCAFRPVRPEAAGLLAPPRPADGAPGGAGRWIVVTCQAASEEARRAHLRERCLTAAQRFMLSLSCDGIENQWVAEAPGPDAFRAAGVALDGGYPVGLIWYGTGER